MNQRGIFGIIVLALILTACTPTGRVTQTEPVKIGILTPLSGDLAFLGKNVVQSAELAIDELGLTGQVELIVEDSGAVGDGAKAVSAYHKLVNEGVTLIIDGMTSDGTLAVAPLLEQDGVVMITPFTGGQNIDEASEYLFRNGPSDIQAGTKPARDIFAAGHTTVALITDNAAYTTDIAMHFRNTYEGVIVADERITPSESDYRATVTKVLARKPQAIVINTADGVSGNYVIKQLAQAGNTAPIYGNFLVFTANTKTVAGAAAEGVYIYDPEFAAESPAVQALFSAYNTKYGTTPVIPFHTTGTYDAVNMFAQASAAVGTDGTAVRDYLLVHIHNWNGMNGNVAFDENGNANTGFVLKQIQSETLVQIA